MKLHGRVVPLLLGLLVGCTSVTDPLPSTDGGVEFTFGVHRPAHEPPFVVSSAGAGLVVRGFLRTPCDPYQASAEVEQVGERLILHVIGRDPGACRHVISSVGYEALLREIPRGVTRLQIVHSLPDTNWPRTAVHEAPLPSR